MFGTFQQYVNRCKSQSSTETAWERVIVEQAAVSERWHERLRFGILVDQNSGMDVRDGQIKLTQIQDVRLNM